MRFKYFAARQPGAHLVRVLIARQSLRMGEDLAVCLKWQPVLDGPLVIKHWIVREL